MTPGRYWFAPEETPVYSGPHLFGSLYYLRGELESVPDLGEVPPSGYSFTDGKGPEPAPLPKVCGKIAYVSEGTTGEPQEEAFIWGLPICCFRDPPPLFPVKLSGFDFTQQALLYLLACFSASSYEPDSGNAGILLGAWLGLPDNFAFYPNDATTIPGCWIATYPTYTILCISGTSNAEQFLSQMMASLEGPTNVGPWGTAPLWDTASMVMHSRMNALGVDPSSPVLLIGHSYGGAVASCLAALYNLVQPGRPLKVITFGSPKAGDSRLQARLNAIGQLRIENDADPIPAIFPSYYWFGETLPIFGVDTAAAWDSFRHGGLGLRLFPSGELAALPDDPSTLAEMVAILSAVFLGVALPVFTTHSIAVYCHYLSNGIPPGWDQYPVTASALAVAKGLYP